MDLSDEDRRILHALQEDARRSFREVADIVGLSTPTVSARVKRLEAMGLILGYTVRLDPALLGLARHVLAVRTRPARAAALAEALAAVPGIEEALVLAGGLVHARASTGDLAPLLARLDGMADIDAYEVHPVVGARLVAASPPVAGDLRVACHECKGPIHGEGLRRRGADGREHWYCCASCRRAFEARLEKRLR